MGKLFNKSLKVFMSFFFGRVLLDVGDSITELNRGGNGGLLFGGREAGNIAGVILISSNIPNNGLDM